MTPFDLAPDLHALVQQVQPRRDPALAAALQQRLDRQTKPTGALGRLEALALQIGLLQGTARPALQQPQLMVFAADHGLARQGVSAYPQDVTWQMVANMRAGGAAVNVLARQHGLALTLVDAGVAHGFEPSDDLVDAKLGWGTADASQGPAMSAEQAQAALREGARLLAQRPGNAVLFGEMGIANTASAALLLARLGGVPIEQATGRGTGLDDAGLARKCAVLSRALARAPQALAPLDVLAEFGGFEIGMIAGAMLQAAAQRRLVVVDGFIVGAALLLAARLAPAVLEACVFAHRGAEAGHAALLATLGAQPLLDLGLRLGEGSGAALAWPLVQSSLRLLDEMASFESAGVSNRAPD
ncbi:MAG: nicotinate-nucleotide--dimethylbenzimidazole phosphoribosyltransferase [Burkholderiales bacterium PBB5]|nr:MAG: nicotinate-nucleotide--dimethylbenzimidazole phosphoribosyltransferase [Burkholderiales bacterium PBB5]